jgi:hypothetical protein
MNEWKAGRQAGRQTDRQADTANKSKPLIALDMVGLSFYPSLNACTHALSSLESPKSRVCTREECRYRLCGITCRDVPCRAVPCRTDVRMTYQGSRHVGVRPPVPEQIQPSNSNSKDKSNTINKSKSKGNIHNKSNTNNKSNTKSKGNIHGTDRGAEDAHGDVELGSVGDQAREVGEEHAPEDAGQGGLAQRHLDGKADEDEQDEQRHRHLQQPEAALPSVAAGAVGAAVGRPVEEREDQQHVQCRQAAPCWTGR